MQNSRKLGLQVVFMLLAIVVSLLLSAMLTLFIGRNPLVVFQQVWEGAFSNITRVAGVFNFWIPLTLASLGLIVTFRAGLWNIGVEGQIMFGAVFASGVAIFLPVPSFIRVPIEIIAAVFGGMLWALLVGVLKTHFGVHEIFGGVALNAIANAITNYLVAYLWSSPGGNARDIGPFDQAARLQIFSNAFPTNLTMIVITLTTVAITVVILRGTRWGLELKASGKNPRSALLLSVPIKRTSLSAFAFCGALAGLVGSYRVMFTYGTLRSLASGGIGFLGILVVLLSSIQALWVPFVSFTFAAMMFGSTHLRLLMGLDTSLTKTLQGILVLLAILSRGVLARTITRRIKRGLTPDTKTDLSLTRAKTQSND